MSVKKLLLVLFSRYQKGCFKLINFHSLIAFLLLFTIGFIGHRSIRYAWAECAPSKVAQLQLDSVSTDGDVDKQMKATEMDRWPRYAQIIGDVFSSTDGHYRIGFSKDAE